MLFGDGYPIDMQTPEKGLRLLPQPFFLTRGDKI